MFIWVFPFGSFTNQLQFPKGLTSRSLAARTRFPRLQFADGGSMCLITALGILAYLGCLTDLTGHSALRLRFGYLANVSDHTCRYCF